MRLKVSTLRAETKEDDRTGQGRQSPCWSLSARWMALPREDSTEATGSVLGSDRQRQVLKNCQATVC